MMLVLNIACIAISYQLLIMVWVMWQMFISCLRTMDIVITLLVGRTSGTMQIDIFHSNRSCPLYVHVETTPEHIFCIREYAYSYK